MNKFLSKTTLIFAFMSSVNADFLDTVKEAGSKFLSETSKKNESLSISNNSNEISEKIKIMVENARESMFLDLTEINLSKLNEKELQILCESIRSILNPQSNKTLLTISCSATNISSDAFIKLRDLIKNNIGTPQINLIIN